MDTDFTRVRETLFCREPDRVPLTEGWVDQEVKEAFFGREIKDIRDEIEFMQKARYDYVHIHIDLKDMIRKTWEESKTGSAYGEKKMDRFWAPEHGGVIQTMKDFENFKWFSVDDFDYQRFTDAAKYLPDSMRIVGSTSGVMEQVWQMMGMETFCYALVDDPALVDAMVNRLTDLCLGIWEKMKGFDRIGALWYCCDVAFASGLMFPRKLWEKWELPLIRRIADITRGKNLPLIYHSDGDITSILEDLIDAGVNCIHPVEPKAMDINELKKHYGERLCFWGNIDLGYTLTRGTPDEVRAEVRERIKRIAPGGGYGVSSSNSVTNYVPLENYKAMIEATLEFGRYPIDL